MDERDQPKQAKDETLAQPSGVDDVGAVDATDELVKTDTDVVEVATGGNDTVAKKTTTRKKKGAAKKAKGAATRTRSRVVASGAIRSAKASGKTYVEITFEDGSMTVTPSSNREQNRDILVKAINALAK